MGAVTGGQSQISHMVFILAFFLLHLFKCVLQNIFVLSSTYYQRQRAMIFENSNECERISTKIIIIIKAIRVKKGEL